MGEAREVRGNLSIGGGLTSLLIKAGIHKTFLKILAKF
jgi:hypothetical protein